MDSFDIEGQSRCRQEEGIESSVIDVRLREQSESERPLSLKTEEQQATIYKEKRRDDKP